jgi:hypothetical protein
MLQFLLSLSLATGALVVALASGVLGAICGQVRPPLVRRALALLVPFALAYSLYWLPVWLGQNPSEYGGWWLVCIPPWYAAGVLTSAAATYGSGLLRAGRAHTERPF